MVYTTHKIGMTGELFIMVLTTSILVEDAMHT